MCPLRVVICTTTHWTLTDRSSIYCTDFAVSMQCPVSSWLSCSSAACELTNQRIDRDSFYVQRSTKILFLLSLKPQCKSQKMLSMQTNLTARQHVEQFFTVNHKNVTFYLASPLGKLVDRAIYFTFRFCFFKLSKAISESTRLIFTIFSPSGRHLCECCQSGPVFLITQGKLPWQPILCKIGEMTFIQHPGILKWSGISQ